MEENKVEDMAGYAMKTKQLWGGAQPKNGKNIGAWGISNSPAGAWGRAQAGRHSASPPDGRRGRGRHERGTKKEARAFLMSEKSFRVRLFLRRTLKSAS